MNIDKHKNFSEWYNTVIYDAKLCDIRYGVKGFVVFLPWSVKTMEMMYSVLSTMLEEDGHLPCWFPSVIPESFLNRESDHIEGFTPEVFWIESAGKSKLENRLALRPTSETAFYTMYSLWINGRKDLPLKLYQRAQVWRYETKATKPFIRTREFYWIETHCAFATKEEAIERVRADMEINKRFLSDKLGIPFIFFRRPEWDKFAGAVDTFASDTIMPDGKVLQLPSTHLLGQNFSRPFGITFMDSDEKEKYVWQTCYGPAVSRIYAALISHHGDNRGLVLPPEFAPVQVRIIPIYAKGSKEKVMGFCKKVASKLDGLFRMDMDERDVSPGFKFNDCELFGIPFRIEIGPREADNEMVTITLRDTREKVKTPLNDLPKVLNEQSILMFSRLKNKARNWMNSMMFEASSESELREILNSKGGMVKVPFCSSSVDGSECADRLKELCGANIRGTVEGDGSPDGKCVSCGKKADVFVYASKQY